MEFICSVKCLVYSAAIILAAVCIPFTLQLQFLLPHGKIHLIQMDTILNSCPPRRDRQHSSISIPFKLSWKRYIWLCLECWGPVVVVLSPSSHQHQRISRASQCCHQIQKPEDLYLWDARKHSSHLHCEPEKKMKKTAFIYNKYYNYTTFHDITIIRMNKLNTKYAQ